MPDQNDATLNLTPLNNHRAQPVKKHWFMPIQAPFILFALALLGLMFFSNLLITWVVVYASLFAFGVFLYQSNNNPNHPYYGVAPR